MCTAISCNNGHFYFGRTLDYEVQFGESIVVMPRHFPLIDRYQQTNADHYAVIGMAHVANAYPLYYDAVNEKGLAMAGLNFVGYAKYGKPLSGKENIASFAFIPRVLAQCANLEEAKAFLKNVQLTDDAFSEQLPPAQLHWLIADKEESITVESVSDGLRIYPNPVGVLTNNPPFPQQMLNLRNYMQLTPGDPTNQFCKTLDLQPYSRGMGALGLPGDLSSQSRFVRAAFTKLNSICDDSEGSSVSQFFHILETVSQTRGCCRLPDGKHEITIYSSCCSAGRGIYYYTTYDNRQITAVDLHSENLDGHELLSYPLLQEQNIHPQNFTWS